MGSRFAEFKEGFGCAACGYRFYGGALSFHHVNPTDKKFCINGNNFMSTEARREITKCLLLCCNCHAEVHGRRLLESLILELYKGTNYNLR